MDKIETNRLILRRFSTSDWADMYDYLSDTEVVKFEPYEPYSKAKCKEAAKKRAENTDFWAVCLKEGGKLIGNLYFKRQEPPKFATWELGYVFGRNYQGKGYATESCTALIQTAFEQLKVRRIVAQCNPLNSASWRLLVRLGFRREAHHVKNVYFKYDADGHPIWQDTCVYALLKEEWHG